MKKVLLTLAIVLFAITAHSQIKVHDDGQISLGSLTKVFTTHFATCFLND